MQKLLNQISSPIELRKLKKEQLSLLAKELRQYIIEIVAAKEGHLGASLGVVELTIALHYVFNTPDDLLIWDVGHQAYVHKILTERKGNFITNRTYGGLSGFPKREESIYDAFGVGHSSTSISAILGMAIASRLKGDFKKQHIAVIGDASIASGMAFEGLNHTGVTNTNTLIILNDNAIGIDPSVGALKNYLTNVDANANIFEALNLDYYGPIDGHDLPKLLEILEKLKKVEGPKLLHLITTKGKGLKQAEEQQVKYHAPGKFDAKTGDIIPKFSEFTKYQTVFGETLLELAKQNEKIIGITPAMPTGSSLNLMIDEIPTRAYDVGIAEQHGVTLAAGLATQGMTVYITIYSTFLQRAYDQLIHDVALQNLPVIFCIDRAGLVGEDGPTHHGVFDIAFLRCIPNLIIAAPSNEIELRNLLYTVQTELKNPIAIRYPRGYGKIKEWKLPFKKIEIGKGKTIQEGNKIAVLTVGTIIENAKEAVNNCGAKEQVSLINMLFIKPIDEKLLREVLSTHTHIITVEDGCVKGGFGSVIKEFILDNDFNVKIKSLGIPDEFIDQGSTVKLQEISGIDSKSILKTINEFLA